EYLRPAFLHEQIVVRTWVATFGKATSLRRYEIHRPADQRLLARASTDWAFVDFVAGRPKRVPAEVADCFILLAVDTLQDPSASAASLLDQKLAWRRTLKQLRA